MIPVFIKLRPESKSLSFKTDFNRKGSVAANIDIMWGSLLYGSQ
jgi:hypothetical protein